jgi:O-antigen/teichoic acid export membrane protein
VRADLTPQQGSEARVVASNTMWRLVAFLARAVAGLVATILVARVEGPAALGVFQLALTITLLASFAVALGLPKMLVREIARHPDQGPRWLETSLFVVLASGAGATALIIMGTHVLGGRTTVVPVLGLAGAALAFDAAARVLFGLFWARERMHLEAATTCLQELAFVGGTVLALTTGHGVPGVMLAYLLSRTLGALIGWLLASRLVGTPLLPRLGRGAVRPLLRRTMPFAVDDALSLAYIRVDAVLLGILQGTTAVGLYQAAANLVIYLNILPRMLNFSLYARMSQAWPVDPAALRRLRDASLRLIGAFGVPLMVGSLLLAPEIIRTIYGPEFDDAIAAFRLLALVIPIRMLGHTLGTALTAVDRQTHRMWAVAGAAITNVVLNLYFIPRWSYMGAAVVTVITELGLFLTYAALLRRVAGRARAVSALSLPAVASLPMALAIVVTNSLPLVAQVGIGAAVYAGAAMITALVVAPQAARLRPTSVLAAYVSPVGS